MPRLVNIDAPATLRAVNTALRALGFHSEQLELVRGQGYYYVAGTDTDILGGMERGLYGMGARLNAQTTRVWVREVLTHMQSYPVWADEEHPRVAARLATAMRELGAWSA